MFLSPGNPGGVPVIPLPGSGPEAKLRKTQPRTWKVEGRRPAGPISAHIVEYKSWVSLERVRRGRPYHW